MQIWSVKADGTRKGCHVQRGISSISECSTASVDTDGNTAHQVTHADSQTCPEQRKTRVVSLGVVQLSALDASQLRREDDGHDDTVDGHDFAKDDGDQVLGSDAGSADTTADNGGAGDKDTPDISL